MKKTGLTLLVLLLSLSCCKKEDEHEIIETHDEITAESFWGEWVSVNSELQIAKMIKFNAMSYIGDVYQNINTDPYVEDHIEGRWAYMPTNNIIRIDASHSVNRESFTKSYMPSVNANQLTLTDVELEAVEQYYRIVETRHVRPGEELRFEYSDESGPMRHVTYSSSNKAIADVDNYGNISACSLGTCFITLRSSSIVACMKIEVSSRADTYISEVQSNIDDIIASHGEPTRSDATEHGRMLFYTSPAFDSGLWAVDYEYDEATREIIYIYTIYGSKSAYEVEKAYLANNYVEVDEMYGLSSVDWQNKFYVYPYITNGQRYIGYVNNVYLLKNY